ncbi:MAG: deoxyguanosinetriphosphate triphosphohydrolase [Deltaproteobacteria bacterium]|nr:deoxyguanosinetriphosphate triphosphohydrolase [Deltaproteobacteria bacterium]
MQTREIYEKHEKEFLAPYAQCSVASLGRQYPEDECTFRPCFYRDLGRIVHSTAFRLLEYKTQVFVNHEGDYYRTRLTHSLEVGQISRGMARILRVNEDLAQTIALAHDLGHAPFGHSGEEALNALMRDDGGFEHNTQSYRIVTELEERYPDFKGLNLSYEVREGLVKHTTDYDKPTKVEGFKDVGYPTIEAQIVNCADEIAFMNHDLDDGLHWGMLSIESLGEVPLWEETFNEMKNKYPNATERIHRCKTISGLIGKLIDDLQAESCKRISDMEIKTLDDVRNRGKCVVSLSDGMKRRTDEAKNFLFQNVYRHPEVVKMSKRGEMMIRDLFQAYSEDPKLMPEKFHDRVKTTGSKRHICDYIAGMTDRFAMDEHKKLFDGK